MTLNFSKTNLVRSKNSFIDFIKGREDFSSLPVNLVFMAFVLNKKGIASNWNRCGAIDLDFVWFFCNNYNDIDKRLSNIREWCIFKDLFSGDEIPSFTDLTEKYSLTYPSSSFRDCTLAISGLFFTVNGVWTYCSPECVNFDNTRVSPLFLGVAVKNSILLNNLGIVSIYDLVRKYIESNIEDLRLYLVSKRVSDDMSILTLLDYVEKGIYDPEYYREAHYLDSSRMVYLVGKYLKQYEGIKIEEDLVHPLSFYLYSPEGSDMKRILVSKPSYAKIKQFMECYSNSRGEDPYKLLVTCLI